MIKKILIWINKVFFFLFLFYYPLSSEQFSLNYNDVNKYQLNFVGNFKVYLNGKYKGLNVREMKGILDINYSTINLHVKGDIYHLKKIISNKGNTGFEINKFESCNFILSKDGIIDQSSDTIFPPIQGIPYFPDKDLAIGDIFENNGKAIVALYDREDIEILEVKAVTQYIGKKEFMRNVYDCFRISYKYGKILKSNNIKAAWGQHNLLFFFDNKNGKPVFMKDNFVEEFELENGDKIKHDGFYDYFYKLILPMDKEELIVELKEDIDKELLKDLDFQKKEEGLSITINNLKFKADSTELLESENEKLNKLLELLLKIKDRSFMIIGHTALAGTEETRMKLSLNRAKTIAEFLINNGIKGERILYTGKGAAEPVVPNDTEENMKKNRRVEIIILED